MPMIIYIEILKSTINVSAEYETNYSLHFVVKHS